MPVQSSPVKVSSPAKAAKPNKTTLAAAVKEYVWPPGTPQWMQETLITMKNAGQIQTPIALASIADEQSKFENAGAGINSSGYGGFFGLQETATYAGKGSISSAILNTDSTASFRQQAVLANQALISYVKTNNTTVIKALHEWTPTTAQSKIFLAAAKTAKPGTITTSWITAAETIASGGLAGGGSGIASAIPTIPGASGLEKLGTILSKFGDIAFWKRVGEFALGGGLVVLGLFLLAQSNKSVTQAETQIVQDSGAAAVIA